MNSDLETYPNKVSIIVPCYKTEEYVEKCIKSIISQTYVNIEIIAVDQNDDNKTYNILNNIRKTDLRVRIIRSNDIKCTGLARNLGIVSSFGEFICFVDSDDYIEDTMIERMHSKITKEYADIAFCNFYYKSINEETPGDKKFSGDFKISDEAKDKYRIFTNPEVANKLYRKKFLTDNNLFFPKASVSEDSFFYFMAIKLTPKMVYIDTPLYYYIKDRPGNSTTQSDYRHIDEHMSIIKAIMEDYSERDFYMNNKQLIDCAIIKDMLFHYISFFYTRKLSIDKAREMYEFFQKSFKHVDIKNIYDDEVKNLYLLALMYYEIVRNESTLKKYKNIIFSASLGGHRMLEYFNFVGVNASYFLDNNKLKQGTTVGGIEVKSPDEIKDINKYNIIIAADLKYYQEIKYQLINMGVNEENIYPHI